MFKALDTIPLFKELDRGILELLEPLFEPFECQPGAPVFAQGDRAEHIYLLLEGTVEVHYKPYDGPPITITSLPPGSIFGWSAAIGSACYTSGTVARERCKAIRMRGRALHAFCAEQPQAGQAVLELLAESVSWRWTNAKEQIQSLLNTSVSRGTMEPPGKEAG